MGWEVGGRFKREETYIYIWLIRVDVWWKPTLYCNYPPKIKFLKLIKLKLKH